MSHTHHARAHAGRNARDNASLLGEGGEPRQPRSGSPCKARFRALTPRVGPSSPFSSTLFRTFVSLFSQKYATPGVSRPKRGRPLPPPMESKKLRRGSSGANEGSGGVFCLVSTVLLSLLVAVAMLYSIKMFGAGIELALNGAVALLMAICMSNGCNCCLKQVPLAAFCTISHPCRRALTPNSPFPLRRTLASLRSGRVPRGWR